MTKTNYQKYRNRIKTLQKKMDVIKNKYPDIEITACLARDLNQYIELGIELIYCNADIERCKSEDPDARCSDCNCWKQAREMSS